MMEWVYIPFDEKLGTIKINSEILNYSIKNVVLYGLEP